MSKAQRRKRLSMAVAVGHHPCALAVEALRQLSPVGATIRHGTQPLWTLRPVSKGIGSERVGACENCVWQIWSRGARCVLMSANYHDISHAVLAVPALRFTDLAMGHGRPVRGRVGCGIYPETYRGRC